MSVLLLLRVLKIQKRMVRFIVVLICMLYSLSLYTTTPTTSIFAFQSITTTSSSCRHNINDPSRRSILRTKSIKTNCNHHHQYDWDGVLSYQRIARIQHNNDKISTSTSIDANNNRLIVQEDNGIIINNNNNNNGGLQKIIWKYCFNNAFWNQLKYRCLNPIAAAGLDVNAVMTAGPNGMGGSNSGGGGIKLRSITKLHNPITYFVLAIIAGFRWDWCFKSPLYWFGVGFCIKWYRARYVFKIPVWDRQPNWNNIITSKEQEKDLKAYTCKNCGSTIFIAKTREFFFEGNTGFGGLGCFTCGAKGRDNFIMDRDRIVEDVGDMDDYFEYERPLDFVSRAERRKLLKEAKGDEEKANQLLLERSITTTTTTGETPATTIQPDNTIVDATIIEETNQNNGEITTEDDATTEQKQENDEINKNLIDDEQQQQEPKPKKDKKKKKKSIEKKESSNNNVIELDALDMDAF